MANAALLKAMGAARIMIVGYPGSAKTGSLACLANAGFKLRVLDFDGNQEPLFQYCTPEGLKNIDIASCEDKLRQGPRYTEVVGNTPHAFVDAWKMMDHWKYTNPDGTVTDLGRSKEWGQDTIVVVDSLTSMGVAAMRQAMFIKNKTPENNTDSTWGFAMAQQEAMVEQLTSTANRFHVIVLAHLKMVGPKDVRKGDDDLTKEIKKELAQLVPTRLWPSALGQALPQAIGGHFPTLLVAETVQVPASNKVKRVLRSNPRPELDLKLPSALPHTGEWDVKDGLLQIFKLLGYSAPSATATGVTEASPATDGAVAPVEPPKQKE